MSKVKDFYPLSPMQEGMLFHTLLEPGSGVYVKQTTHQLRGDLNIAALQSAWQEIVDRNSILRTFFLLEDLKKPVQVVEPKVSVLLSQKDWRGLSPADQEEKLREYLSKDLLKGFDLTRPPLMRLVLIQFTDETYRLIWTWHHILMDGWSEGLLIKELFQSYRSYCRGRKPRLPRTRPFRDYIHWLQQQDITKAEEFWRRTLKGFTSPIALGKALSAEQEEQSGTTYERTGVQLSKETTDALQSFARSNRVTLNTILQGAWALVLSRYSGRTDVLFGAVVSGRPADLEGVESMLGLFVSTLPVRVEIDSETSLLQWLSNQQSRQAEALRFDYSPLSQVQKWSAAPRGVPLVESILAFDMSSLNSSVPARMEKDIGLKIEEPRGVLQISNPISVLIQAGRQLFLGISYDPRRFAAEFVQHLLSDFQHLLESFVARPDLTLSSYLAEIGPAQSISEEAVDELTEICDRSNLTRNQVIIWLGQNMDPEAPIYNIPCFLNLSGSVDLQHLEKAFRAIVDSSDALRTVFTEQGGVPQQQVLPTLEWNLDHLDFSFGKDPRSKLHQWARARCVIPFNLAERLFDCVLIKLDERQFVLYFNAHHLIIDAWSISVLLRNLLPIYESFAKGQSAPVSQIGQFSDYLAHERQHRHSAEYKAAETFWQQELAETTEPLAYYGKPAIKKGSRVEKVSFDLDYERSDKLKENAVKQGTFLLSQEFTVFTIFSSLVAAFLHRITGAERISLGIYFHNRRGFRDTIGLLMHVHPLRVTVDEDDSFQSLIKKTQSEYLKILKYREYPIANPLRNPVYDVLINYVNTSHPSQLNGATAQSEWLNTGYGTESINIEFDDYESTGRFGLGIRFHEDVFNETQQKAAIRHFLQILDSYLADSSKPIALAGLLTDEERRDILVKFNQTRWEYPRNITIVEQFENQVEQTPDKIAVVIQEQVITYRQLNTRANQLAHYLRKLGIGPESLVGLLAERSIELEIGMLGILKAGAAFVPCDPDYPQERVQFILEDGGASVLLTQQRLAQNLSGHMARLICLDSDWDSVASESGENAVNGLTTDNIAYVIYTSGSTGRPKGTMIQQGSLFDYNQTATHEYGVTPDDRILQFCSLGFDISIEEIIPCLTHGATLVFRTDEMLETIPTFLQTCQQWDITMMSLPTAFWHEMTEGIDAFSLPLYEGLRLVIIAGEKVLPEKLSIWQRHVGNGAQLINTYGLTESTIISTAIDLTSLTLEGRESREVPIGCAIRNTQMYVLDKNLEPVPGSMPGELYIGGRLLSRGYYQRPELTAQRFVPNPYSDEPGTRLYKTGDLARFLSDASLEFLGRADRQVKIRGFRVELEEIAANLRQHSGVRDCVVVLREDQPGHKQLVAYVVLRSQSVSSGDQLRAYLAQSLPDYMIPTAFVMLEALPVSPNGKVDLKALPAPDRSNLSLDKSYVAPRTAIEKELADIWGSVLGLDRVGIHDNYFDLGGDSIRSIQIRAKAQQHGLGFSIQHLFQHQTIEELAIVCAQQGGECGPIALTEPFSLITEEDRAKIPDGVEDAYPLARLQAGMLFHNLYHLNSDLYMDVSMAHLQLQCNVDALRAAIGKLISRHPILRTSFDLGGYSEPVQLVWSEAPVLLTVDDITDMSSDAQDRFLRQWLYEETRRQFDLTKPPLMRFHVHLRSEKTFQFTWSNHHAILDGWSMAVMLSELFQLYGAELSGKESKVGSPPAVPYREFVALEREVLNSEEAKNYLTDKVRDLVVTTLPRRPSLSSRPAVPDIQSFSLVPPLKLCEELKRLAATNSIPIKSFVLAAQMKVLSLITGQSDITTGMVMSGRPEVPDGDRVLGLFTNTVPMRLTLSGGTWIELVKQVFDAEAAVVPYRRFPISELKTIEGGQILFETMFNFTHFYLYKTVPRISGARIFDVKVRGASNYVFVTDCNMDISSPQFELAFSYDATLIDHEQAKAFSHCYLRALEAIAENPYGRYELMSALSPTEWEKIVVQWNSTSVDYPHEKLIHQLFEEQADRAPDARAITYEGQQLTYAELNRRANQLAHHLRKLGIGTDKLVAVVAERSIEMVVALFGILKAGGAYVPLDPSYPKDRLEFMLRDSGASLMLTQSHLLRFLPGLLVEQLCLDSDWSLIADEPSENLATVIDPENLVYMIYTSGSTGQPKGALNTHHGLHNRLLWMQQQYQLSDADQVMQKTPFSFDVSVWEFFWPLITGASLVLARPGGHQDGNYLVHLINDAQVTVLHFVPSMLQAFLDQPDVESCQSLRQVICSGEALSYEMQERFNERLSASLDNLYGPTEASIDVTFWHCRPDQTRSVPIGRPIANTQIYLLDPSLQPVPIGAPGELYIGGAGLARGYHARSNLTAQKFIPNPFSTGRLYRTGDIARYRSDGEIEYLGRSDHQVKIRGFRVELGEIEAVLRGFDNIKDLLVQSREERSGEKMLIAYIVYDHEPAPTIADIRKFLERKLPDHMIPSGFVMMQSFPLTPNGKINRRALAEMKPGTLAVQRAFVAPRDSVETRLASIWEDVFKTRPISIEDNFFDLGGNSILAVKLMAKVHKEFGQPLPLNILAESGNIARLAGLLRRELRKDSESPIVPIQPNGDKPPFFCVHPLGGHVLRFYELAQKLGEDQPFYGIQGRDLTVVENEYFSIEQMAEMYVEGLRETQLDGPYHIGGYSFGSFVAFEMAQQLTRSGQEVALLVLLDTWAPAIVRTLPEFEKDSLLLSVIANEMALRLGRKDFQISASDLDQYEGDEQLRFFVEQVRKSGMITEDIPEDISLPYLRHLMTGIRTRNAAVRNYQPVTYDGKITFIRCLQQDPTMTDVFAAAGVDVDDPTSGWSLLSTQPVDVHTVYGYHERMMEEPTVAEVAKVLSQCLTRKLAAVSGR